MGQPGILADASRGPGATPPSWRKADGKILAGACRNDGAPALSHCRGPPPDGIRDRVQEFAMKGNVVDLAVGVIIGGAFGKDRRLGEAI